MPSSCVPKAVPKAFRGSRVNSALLLLQPPRPPVRKERGLRHGRFPGATQHINHGVRTRFHSPGVSLGTKTDSGCRDPLRPEGGGGWF